MLKKSRLLIVPLFFLILAWSNNPGVNTPICTAPGDQQYPKIITGGSNGFYTFWQDNQGLYCQRINQNGNLYWTGDGKKLVEGMHYYYYALPDAAGGFYIIYEESIPYSGSWYNLSEVHIIRFDSNGNKVWGDAPKVLDIGHMTQMNAKSDALGNIFIATLDDGPCSIYSEFATHVYKINPDGTTAGSLSPNCLSEANNIEILADGNGGCFAAWEDLDNDTYWQIYANWYPITNGVSSWQSLGVEVSDIATAQKLRGIFPDGIGGIVIFYEAGSSFYAQRINSKGEKLWGSSGILLQTSGVGNSVAVPSDNGNVLLFWNENGNIHSASYDQSGVVSWNYILKGKGTQKYLINAIPDGKNGVVVSWADSASNDSTNLLAQRINSTGSYLWQSNGVTVSADHVLYGDASCVTDGSSGAVFIWRDGRNTDADIYAQKIDSTGKLGYPNNVLSADITADRSGGIAPAVITFDAYKSFSSNGNIISYNWTFDDNTSEAGPIVSHTFNNPGRYIVHLNITDDKNRTATDERTVIIYSADQVSAGISLNPPQIKANHKETSQVQIVLYNADSAPHAITSEKESDRIMINLAPNVEITSGTIYPNILKGSSGIYTATIYSGEPGAAALNVIVDGRILGTANIQYNWPQPPVDIKISSTINRSLFKVNDRTANISWLPNPAQIYPVDSYLIYRSINGNPSSYELIGKVSADTFSYTDKNLASKMKYIYVLKAVDLSGDMSENSSSVTIESLK